MWGISGKGCSHGFPPLGRKSFKKIIKIKGKFVIDSKNSEKKCLRRAKIEENNVTLSRNEQKSAKISPPKGAKIFGTIFDEKKMFQVHFILGDSFCGPSVGWWRKKTRTRMQSKCDSALIRM